MQYFLGDVENLMLTSEQQEALKLATSENWQMHALFITGPAGTGKSTLLKAIVKELRKNNKKYAVLASTGIAAINVQGQTIHSFFNFPPRIIRYESPDDIPIFSQTSEQYQILKHLEYLIIDEISMVRADILDAIDFSLRQNRGNTKPFGGVKIIFFGDLLQLEPVVKKEEKDYLFQVWKSPFFFSAKIWDNATMGIFYLKQIIRQEKDKEFSTILRKIRFGNKLAFFRLKQLIKVAKLKNVSGSKTLILTPYRKTAQQINTYFLEKIASPSKTYTAKINGQINLSDMPISQEIKLKQNARVMIMLNDPNKEFVNGDLGTIVKLENDNIKIQLDRNNKVVTVHYKTWEKFKFVFNKEADAIEPQLVGEFTQIPVRLAWAITIHKSQGLTLNRVHILLGKGTFAHGQLYVALSRCKNLKDITIDRLPRFEELAIRPEVLEFINSTTPKANNNFVIWSNIV